MKDTKRYTNFCEISSQIIQSIIALARLYLARGELDPCQHQCITLLRMDAGNEEASMMLADLMFRKNEYEAATFHFKQLLEKKPNHYVALSRLIHLLRRSGRLNEVPAFLSLAENLSKRSSMEPGLHYCKGLYARYTNNPRTALTEFYATRKDNEWGELGLVNMIEVYLNPENESLLEVPSGEDKEYLKAVNSAKELLKVSYFYICSCKLTVDYLGNIQFVT
jgi:tetratricopeptide repeat protein 21B